jgi:FAD-dependent urate hydroxylase
VVATVRGLHRAGYQVTAVAGTRLAPGHWSRSVDERLHAPRSIVDEEGFADAIEREVGDGLYDVLIPGGEASLRAISSRQDRFESHVRTGLRPHEVLQRSLDKRELIAAASRHGLTSPETVTCNGVEESLEAARRLGFPVILKPTKSILDGNGQRRQLGSIWVSSERALRHVAAEYGDPLLLQRAERGTVLSFGGVLADGRLLGEALSCYRRTWYPEAGSVSFSQTVAIPPALRERTVALLEDLGWEGIFELELIERSGEEWAAIDLNPRPYGSLALAIGAGANLPGIWSAHLMDRAPEPVTARPGVFYRWEDADLRYVLWQLRHGDIGAVPAVLRPHRGTVHPHFELSDPGPFLARSLYLATAARRRAQSGSGVPDHQDVRDPTPLRKLRGRLSAGSCEPVVVIGAGPYGLAGAAHLRGAGIDVRCFGEPLEYWRGQMPEGMVLRSRRRSTHIADPGGELTIDHYEADERKTVRSPSLLRDEFVDYGMWFQRRAVPALDRRKVTSVALANSGFALTLSDGEELRARRVVVATGLAPFARRPAVFGSLPEALVSHACAYGDLSVLAGQDVAVVGAGQSALESAALLDERGATVQVLARAPIRWLPDDTVTVPAKRSRFNISPPPTDVGGRLSGWIAATPDVFRRTPVAARPWVSDRCIRPAGSGWLRPRLGAAQISYGVSVVAAAERGGRAWLRLSDGSERTVDHVLLGTGYAIDIAKYPFLAPELVAQIATTAGYPRLGPGLESSVPGLHFLGAPAALSFGPIMRFVVGTWYAAPALACKVEGRMRPPIRFAFHH